MIKEMFELFFACPAESEQARSRVQNWTFFLLYYNNKAHLADLRHRVGGSVKKM